MASDLVCYMSRGFQCLVSGPHPLKQGPPPMGCAKSDVQFEQDSASSCTHIVNSLSADSALSIHQTLCLMRWWVGSGHETEDFMVVCGSQTPDYKAAPFILPGKEMCSYVFPRDVFSPSQQYTVWPLLNLVGSLCLPLHRTV